MEWPSEARLRDVVWEGLSGVAPALDLPLAEILAGAPAERVVARVLRARPGATGAERAAVAEALFGVGLWRRRLRVQLGREDAPPRLLLGGLVRDLGGRADAERLVGLAPGALPLARPPPRDLADRASLPGWLRAEIESAAGPGAPALSDALDLPGPVCLRANLLATTRDEARERLLREGVATRPGRLAPAALVVEGPRPNVYGLASWQQGLVEVQDEGSQLVGALVGARGADTVLDACAGAGGKTLLLAADVGGSGCVHATDPDPARLVRLGDRARKAGAARIVRIEGAAAPPELQVDRALVDAPCSELGALRRGPDLRWRIDPAGFAALPPLQLGILAAAASRVRVGGRLVYATCTFRREEDEEVALAFERDHPSFTRVLPDAADGVVTAEGFARTWPHVHGTDAFFAAVWERGR